MYRALGLLLLAAEGALAQSREPSLDWDDNVPGYSNLPWAINWTYDGTKVTCPCSSTAHDCRPANEPSMTQTHTSTLQVNWNNKTAVKFAYLTDQDGTIISYMDGGWDNPDLDDVNARIMTFSWDSNKQPARLVPHIVYEDSCADVFPSVAKRTWRSQLALLSEKYDVGNSPTEIPLPPSSPPSPPAPPPLAVNTPPTAPPPPKTPTPVPEGTPTISRTSTSADPVTLNSDWFTTGGKAKATFDEITPYVGKAPPGMPPPPTPTSAAWITTQDGTIIDYQVRPEDVDFTSEDVDFPRGTVELHACRLFSTKKLCATASLVDKYIGKIDDISLDTEKTTNVAYATDKKAFTDVFSGHFDKGAGRTSIGPKSGTCTQYVIYAKKSDDDSLLAFAFDKAIHFDATTATTYKVTLTCDGDTSTVGTMDLEVFDVDSTPEGTFAVVPPPEVIVDSKRCHDHDGHDHAEGAKEEEEEGYASDNTTWFKHEGRDCMCDMGTLKCKRADAGSPFSMNEGETVGLVIAVSAIVFICIGAIFFFGYSAMLKRKARDTGVVLQSDGDRL